MAWGSYAYKFAHFVEGPPVFDFLMSCPGHSYKLLIRKTKSNVPYVLYFCQPVGARFRFHPLGYYRNLAFKKCKLGLRDGLVLVVF